MNKFLSLLFWMVGCSISLSLGCSSSPADSTDGPCVEGDTTACVCPDGTNSARVCDANGAFGPCLACVGTDMGRDTAPDDASMPDGGDPCTNFGSGEPPTPGFCDGDKAVNCGEDARTKSQTCAADERCVTVDALDPDTDTEFAWATCVDSDAERCEYLSDPSCRDETRVEVCQLVTPSELEATQGFTAVLSCRDDEECVDAGVCAIAGESCTDGDVACEGNFQLECTNGRWVRMECEAGTVCVSAEACGDGVECVDPYYLGDGISETCTRSDDAVGVISSCTADGQQVICDSQANTCFGESECRCIPIISECFGDAICEDPAGLPPACVPNISCAAGSRCENGEALLCRTDDYKARFDCTIHGMTCNDGADPACTTGTSCSLTDAPSCTTLGLVEGCCPESGEFQLSLGTKIPCVPGELIQFECPSTPGGSYTCQNGDCVFQ